MQRPRQRCARAVDRRTRPRPRIRAARQCRCNVCVVVPSTGFVDPFEVAIAALENAVANGVTFMRSAPVEAIEVAGSSDDARFTLATPLATCAAAT